MSTVRKIAKPSTREMLIGLGFDAELLNELLEWYRRDSDKARCDELKSVKRRLKTVHDGLTNIARKIKRLETVIKQIAAERPGFNSLDGRRLDEYLAISGRPAMYNPRDFQRWQDEISSYAESVRESCDYFAEHVTEFSTSAPIQHIVLMCRFLSRRVTYKELANLLNEDLGNLGPADKPVTEEAVRQHFNRLKRRLRQLDERNSNDTKNVVLKNVPSLPSMRG
jgi:hypothetical protein